MQQAFLEADVDIRYIQEMLGHSSINITQIYTHVAMSKQRDILINKHPRKEFSYITYKNKLSIWKMMVCFYLYSNYDR